MSEKGRGVVSAFFRFWFNMDVFILGRGTGRHGPHDIYYYGCVMSRFVFFMLMDSIVNVL